MRPFTLILAAATLLLCGCLQTAITFGPVPATMQSGAAAPVAVTVTTRPNSTAAWAPAAPGTVSFAVDQAGSVTPASAISTVGTGGAGTTFTAGVVAVPTTATITVGYGRASATKAVLVVPPTVSAPFVVGSSVPVAGEDVSISPTVTKTPGGWTYTYLLTPGTAGAVLNTIDVTFAVPVTVVAPGFTATPYPSGRQGWQVTNLIKVAGISTIGVGGPITLTVTGDFSPGGVATWDVTTRNLTGAPIMHANLTTVGPK